jgi:S1-C subfamily serine protease
MSSIRVFVLLFSTVVSFARPMLADGIELKDVQQSIVSVRWDEDHVPAVDLGVSDFVPSRVVISRDGTSAEPNLHELEIDGKRIKFYAPQKQQKETVRVTGFVVDGRIVCVLSDPLEKQDALTVIDRSGHEHQAKIAAWHPASSLTVLTIVKDGNKEARGGLPISDSEPQWGDEIRIAHEWREGNPALLRGIVSTAPQFDGPLRTTVFDLDAAVPSNAIGAPVLNSDNAVVGIVAGTRSATESPGPGIALHYSTLGKLLEFVESGSSGPLPRSMIGIALTSTPEGVAVGNVIDNSPAEEAGIFAGDVILTANGEEANRPEDVIMAVEQLLPGESLKLHIARGDQLHDVELKPTQLNASGASDATWKAPASVSVVPMQITADSLAIAEVEKIVKSVLEAHGMNGNSAQPLDELQRRKIRSALESAIPNRTTIMAIPPNITEQLKLLQHQMKELQAQQSSTLELLEKLNSTGSK